MSDTLLPRREPGHPVAELLARFCLVATTVLGVVWIFDVPLQVGLSGIIMEQFLLLVIGLSTAAAFLVAPFGKRAGWFEIILALIALAAWAWAARYQPEWVVQSTTRGVERWLPGLIALVLLMVALYQTTGLAITLTMGLLGLYGFVGHWIPGLFNGEYVEPRRLIIYLYIDANGVPGVIVATGVTLVLAFIIFAKSLEVAGAGSFFDRAAMAVLGTFRGGAAKVCVISSALFGMISGSVIANVVSSGVVTIPMMIRSGFRPSMAAGVEASSSTAGQITPPVMGATAFLIAEFLQIPYSEVVLAAIIPSAVFYIVMLLQIDSYAARNKLAGLPRSELPTLRATLADGWIFLIPIAVLVYLMFWDGMRAEKAAIYSAVTMVVLGALRRAVKWRTAVKGMTIGIAEEMLPIILVSAASGIVVGVLNISGLSFSITLALTQIGENAGVIPLLLITAILAIILGTGLPTVAIYILLSVLLGPALTRIGLDPLAAHMFIFYFGMMSFLTPPVAMSSYTAATIAGSDMWTTSVDALRIGVSGYLLPFVFAMNPALILRGPAIEVFYAVTTVILSGAFLSWSAEKAMGATPLNPALRLLMLAASLVVGSSTLWLGASSPLNIAMLAGGGVLIFAVHRLVRAG